MENIRESAVAGQFYPESPAQLLSMLKEFVPKEEAPQIARAVIVPHAGYIYSGPVAGKTFSQVVIPDTVILLGPNHTGYGVPYSVSAHTGWRTPLGEVEIDKQLAKHLVEQSNYLEEDNLAHLQEHSLEVQVPFLQYLNPRVKIVPIILSGPLKNPAWSEIGLIIAEAIAERREPSLIVASSDMTHYEDKDAAESKDRYALEAIKVLNERLLAERIEERNISMCGYAPVMVSLIAAKHLGAKSAKVLVYSNSGEVSGDYQQVVGYAGVIIA